MSDNSLVLQGTRDYLLRQEVQERFEALLGNAAMPYVQGVLLQVATNKQLQQCSPQSVATAAIEAAVLRLSVLPKMKEAYIVPYRRGRLGYVAEMVIHYQGLYKLMMRSGLYRGVNVVAVYEGEEVYEDLTSGLHSLLANGAQEKTLARRVTRYAPQNTIGWLGFSETITGIPKTVYMPEGEIEEHAREYSQAYKTDIKNGWKNSNWSAPKGSRERQVMEMKTVLRRLAGWSEKALSGKSDYEQALDLVSVTAAPAPPSLSARLLAEERADSARLDEIAPEPEEIGLLYSSARAVRVMADAAQMSAAEAARVLKALYRAGTIDKYTPESRLRAAAAPARL